MSNVVYASFGAEREWERTREAMVAGLVAIGAAHGDDENLMRAKAERVHRLLRECIEDLPRVTIESRLPGNLTAQQVEIVSDAIRTAALKGMESALTHTTLCLMNSIFDLCTSKLKEGA